jgi:hypothetical protein
MNDEILMRYLGSFQAGKVPDRGAALGTDADPVTPAPPPDSVPDPPAVPDPVIEGSPDAPVFPNIKPEPDKPEPEVWELLRAMKQLPVQLIRLIWLRLLEFLFRICGLVPQRKEPLTGRASSTATPAAAMATIQGNTDEVSTSAAFTTVPQRSDTPGQAR